MDKYVGDARTLPAINFFDLAAQQGRLRQRFEERFSAILDHGQYINGPEVTELEEKLSKWTGAKDAVAVGSGTQALVMPLIAAGLGHGDAVFLPAFTYNATANAVLLASATPVFVDVDPETFNMDPADLERRIEAIKRRRDLRPRAVIPVDLFGTPADYSAIQSVADANNLMVLADGAQSFGGKQDGKWVGAIAPVTATSFYPSKALGGYGDGGAILVEDPDMAETLRSIRWHGTGSDRRDSVRVGINGRLDSIQCAIVSEKMDIFDEELERRKEIAAIYEDRLKGLARLQKRPAKTESGYGLFTVAVEKDRDGLRARLQEKGVPTAVYYMKPLHRMPAFEEFPSAGGLPHCEALSEQVVSLPMHAYLSDAQAHYVCDMFEQAVKG